MKVCCKICDCKLSKRERKLIEATRRAITGREAEPICVSCALDINKVAAKMKKFKGARA